MRSIAQIPPTGRDACQSDEDPVDQREVIYLFKAIEPTQDARQEEQSEASATAAASPGPPRREESQNQAPQQSLEAGGLADCSRYSGAPRRVQGISNPHPGATTHLSAQVFRRDAGVGHSRSFDVRAYFARTHPPGLAISDRPRQSSRLHLLHQIFDWYEAHHNKHRR